MTGLDPDTCRILELAVLITDFDLRVVAEGPTLVVHQADEVLARMDEWNTRTHGDSGLTERVRVSTLDEASAEREILDFVAHYCKPRTAPLAGNSIYQDRRFLAKYMPNLEGFLHYRLVDVSTLKELSARWHPSVYEKRPKKKGSHRALDDILESIEELRFYREHLIRPPTG